MVRTSIPQPEQEEALITLSKRMFLGGCLFLPWLWFVNVCYFWNKVYGNDRASIGTDTHLELSKWVTRSLVGALLGLGLFTAWVIIFQLHWKSWGTSIFPYMVSKPSTYSSGW